MRDWQAYVRERLALPELAREREQRIVRELAAQLEDFYREALARGLSEAQAAEYARQQVQDWAIFAAEIRKADRPHVRDRAEQWADKAEEARVRKRGRWVMFADLIQDARYALRQLRKNPGFTAVAVLTLALGIGANTAIFSAVHAVLLRPFPYADPDRLAVISISWDDQRFWLSEREVVLLREQSTLFEGFAILDETGAILLGEGEPRWLNVGLVSSNTFPLVGAQPAIGRLFTPEEEQPNGPAVIILSHELWQSRFGGDRNILGQVLPLESARPPRVIGVMPRGFHMLVARHLNFHRRVDAWYPLQVDYRTINRGRNLVVLARVKKGVEWAQAQHELDRIAKGYFPAESRSTYRAFPLHADTVAEVRPALLLLLAATGFVLLIVCANVANLLLARGAARHKELAIRAALGASRTRMIRQSLTESCLLALCGAAAGILLAWTANRVLSTYLPPQLPRLESIQLDGVVLGVSIGVSLLAGVFFGLAPALRATRVELDTSLKEGVRGQSSAGAKPLLRNALIVAEIAVALMLLLGGSLIVRSFLNLQSSPLGYDPTNVLRFTITLPSQRYPTPAARSAFFRALQEKIAGIPGVESVGGASILPFATSLFQTGFTFYDSGDGASGENPVRSVLARPILPGYFETMQTRLLAGRLFTHADTADSERVAIIDETLAQSVWPNESPLGKRMARGGNPKNPEYFTVVGVVENLRIVELTGERRYQAYLPHAQFSVSRVSFLVRARSEPTGLLAPIRDMVHSLDPRLPLYDVGRLDETVAEVMAPQRITSLLMALFAGMGLMLAVIGVYGVVSYAVNQQTHEIGIRMALGATRGNIFRMIVGSGLRLAVVGAVAGIAGALALSRYIQSLLFGVSADSPADFAIVTLAVLLAALLACYVPARRATRVDPMRALRYE